MESALADIIDNSITAQASIINILVEAPGLSEACIKIIDNGIGMVQEELDNAMTLGGRVGFIKERGPKDLGRYGLGLKTASWSQCKSLTVITKKNNNFLAGRWDLDYLKSHDSFDYLVIPQEESLELIAGSNLESWASGTMVIWKNFDRLSDTSTSFSGEFNAHIAAAKKHIALVFHRYLKGESDIQKIAIDINGEQIQPNDPFLLSLFPSVAEPSALPFQDSRIIITPHKLPHPDIIKQKLTEEEQQLVRLGSSLLETQGFYIYRNKRLIIWGTWFKIAPKTDKTKLCRIQVDIPNTLDTLWSLDIKKANANPPEVVRNSLRNYIESASELSIKTFRKRTSKKPTKPYWEKTKIPGRQAFSYSINLKHPEVEALINTLDSSQKASFMGLLKRFGDYFPVNQLQFDLQNDVVIETSSNSASRSKNEIFQYIDNVVQCGLSLDQIKDSEPLCDYPEYLEEYNAKHNC